MNLYFPNGVGGSRRTIAVERALEQHKLDCALRLNHAHPDAINSTPYTYVKKLKKKRKTYAY